ncbi:MAG TPA: ABC transporter permease [Terriglobales bacterium]|nr:ABC transporter permease [Terriglobales bacterium]
MDFLSTMRLALRALARNKLRSGLTMLGIIIGVGAVIAMVGIGQGADRQIQQQISNMGSNMLMVMSGSVNRGGLRVGGGATKTLVYEDKEAVERQCPSVAAVAPGTQTSSQVVYGNDNWGTRIIGTSPQYFDIRAWPVAAGVIFDQQQVEQNANVAVIGETVRKNLFGAEDAVGKTVRIKNYPFTIIGVLNPKGSAAGMGDDQDDQVFIPFTTHQKKLTGETWLRYMMVSAVSLPATTAAQSCMEGLLRERHRIRAGMDDDFTVRNLKDIADQASQASQVMTVLLASIASVSLLVGGIGIMNIMLVSVTERTREIGIRIALGATEEDVQRQFLIEAFVLSAIGGAIGILTGVGASYFISSKFNWPVLVSPTSILVAAIFSMAIGIFFGYYPARKASRLDPIEALRYE